MAIFAISDLHLPLGVPKSMEVFGGNWSNYVERIAAHWTETVGPDDCVILSGDTSWATYLEEAYHDFSFLSGLPGIKLVSKGNHDYWWTTKAKLNQFREEHGFDNIVFLHNDAYLYQNTAICACRGWITPMDKDFGRDDLKIYEREKIRLGLSLDEAKKLNPDRIICSIHYPPNEDFGEILDAYGVDFCVYGHLHGDGARFQQCKRPNTRCVSSDFLEFVPAKLDF